VSAPVPQEEARERPVQEEEARERPRPGKTLEASAARERRVSRPPPCVESRQGRPRCVGGLGRPFRDLEYGTAALPRRALLPGTGALPRLSLTTFVWTRPGKSRRNGE